LALWALGHEALRVWAHKQTIMRFREQPHMRFWLRVRVTVRVRWFSVGPLGL